MLKLILLNILVFFSALQSVQAVTCASLFKGETVKVSSVQYFLEGNQTPDSMLIKMSQSVREAKAQGSDLIMFPELIALDLLPTVNDSQIQSHLRNIAENQAQNIFDRVAELAQAENISILAGSIPILENNNIYNRSMIAFPDGKKVYQDKLFLTPDEVDWGWAPGNKLQVFNAPWGKTTILICYDCEFPIISNMLAKHKPELILIPSMTESQYGFRRVRWSAQARAIEHRSYIIHTGTVGTLFDWPQYGQAATMTPSEAGYPGLKDEGRPNTYQVVTTELDIGGLRKTRLTRGPHPARDQNERTEPIEVIDE